MRSNPLQLGVKMSCLQRFNTGPPLGNSPALGNSDIENVSSQTTDVCPKPKRASVAGFLDLLLARALV